MKSTVAKPKIDARPIFMNADMIRANLARSKTQTTRPMVSTSPEMTALMMNMYAGINVDAAKAELIRCNCPFGKVGDQLYVRETCRLAYYDYESCEVRYEYAAGGEQWVTVHDSQWVQGQMQKLVKKGLYREDPELGRIIPVTADPLPWTPSIHMPRIAARIWKEITDIRIECLGELGYLDALHEGVLTLPIEFTKTNYPLYSKKLNEWLQLPKGHDQKPPEGPRLQDMFLTLYSLLYPDSESDDFVWVISYKILSTTGRPVADQEAAAV